MEIERRQFLSEAKSWVWATQKQIKRFNESLDQWLEIISKTDLKVPFSTEEQKIANQQSIEIHFLLIAANNLVKILRKRKTRIILKGGVLSRETQEQIEALRHILEHWDKTKDLFSHNRPKIEKSEKYFSEKIPDKTPWSFSFSNIDGHTICGILNLDSFEKELGKLEESMLMAEKTSTNKEK